MTNFHYQAVFKSSMHCLNDKINSLVLYWFGIALVKLLKLVYITVSRYKAVSNFIV